MRLLKIGLYTFIAAISLSGCGNSSTSGSSSGGSGNELTLNVDQMSPVPLVNGSPQTFYMYATNYGTTQLSNLNWSAKLQSTSVFQIKNAAIKPKLNSLPTHSKIKPQDDANPITIVDASQCTTIAAGSTCRIELQATAPGVVTLSAKSDEQEVVLQGGGGLIQADNYPTSYKGNLADTLTLSQISNVSYGGSGGSYNFYIINNGTLPVALTASSVGNLPANTTLVLGNCPSPLSGGQACQARLVFTNPTGSTTQNLSIPLILNGNLINPDGSTMALPAQNGDATLNATTAPVGVIQRVVSQSLVVDASSGTAAPVTGAGVISNAGTGPLTISSVSAGSNLITINNDTCSGKTLSQGQNCAYTPSLNVASITSSGSELVNISYQVSTNAPAQTTTSSINWTYTAPTPVNPSVVPSLTMTANSLFNQNITQETNGSSSYVVTLTNNSTAYLGADATLSIPYASLLPTNDSAASYAVNVTGISSHPCSLPSSGNTMTLAANTSCSYNLVITAGSSVSASTSKTLTTNYSYNDYTSGMANLTPAPALNNSYNLQVTPALAQLSVSVVSGQNNNFNAIEQGKTPYPTLDIVITNTGTRAVSGDISATFPSGITGAFPPAACGNLAAKESCTATLTMPTNNTIAAANLNTVDLNYNNGVMAATADLPSINYSVVTPLAPIISMVESVTGCYSGNGTTTTCMNNPNTMGGTASNMQVVLTFTNTSESVAATSLTLSEGSRAAFAAYTQASNNCGSGVAANNGTCMMVYNMPPAAESQAVSPNVNQPNFAFNYNYVTVQGQSKNQGSTTSLAILINVVAPSLSIAPIESITQGESGAVTLTWSNLYQASVPTTNVIATESDGVTAALGLTPNPATTASCGSPSGAAGAICNSTINTTGSTAIGSAYKLTATNSIISPQVTTFTILPLLTFYAANHGTGWDADMYGQARTTPVSLTESQASAITNGIQGADAICMYEAAQPGWHPNIPSGKKWKAMLVDGVNRIACTSANCSTGGINENHDWVFKPNQQYRNENQNLIGTTTESAIFQFPTLNPLISYNASSAGNRYYTASFTGLSLQWTPIETQACVGTTVSSATSKYANSSESMSARVGMQDKSQSDLSGRQLNQNTFNCSERLRSTHTISGIICVQQE